jgi:hypothetical protein
MERSEVYFRSTGWPDLEMFPHLPSLFQKSNFRNPHIAEPSGGPNIPSSSFKSMSSGGRGPPFSPVAVSLFLPPQKFNVGMLKFGKLGKTEPIEALLAAKPVLSPGTCRVETDEPALLD